MPGQSAGRSAGGQHRVGEQMTYDRGEGREEVGGAVRLRDVAEQGFLGGGPGVQRPEICDEFACGTVRAGGVRLGHRRQVLRQGAAEVGGAQPDALAEFGHAQRGQPGAQVGAFGGTAPRGRDHHHLPVAVPRARAGGHRVVLPSLTPYDASEDTVLLEGLRREGAGWAEEDVRLEGLLTAGSEADARRLVEQMALALQASLLVRHAPPAVADAFCATRLGGDWGHAFGTFPDGADVDAVRERSLPVPH